MRSEAFGAEIERGNVAFSDVVEEILRMRGLFGGFLKLLAWPVLIS
jgi:hypothetical protein